MQRLIELNAVSDHIFLRGLIVEISCSLETLL